MTITATALEGLERAQRRLDSVTTRIARLPNPEDQVDLSAEVIALLDARHQFEANLRALEAADRMEESLLDVFG